MISARARRWILVGLLIVLGVLSIVAGRQWARLRIGASDFNAYWSASRLLLEGRNPVDPASLLEMERQHYDPNQGFAMMAWNPPTAWVLLLPLACLPFQAARVIWLLINIALVMGSCVLWAGLYLPRRRVAPPVVYGLLTALFAPTLLAIWTGQITFLVVFGVASALFLMRRGQWFWAGASLILTSVKPHLVILVVPYLLFYMAMRRKWSGWLGLGFSGAICLVVLFALRPSWITDFSGLFQAPPSGWATPTLGGLLSLYGAGWWARYLVIGFLVLVPLFLRWAERLSPETATNVLILVTIPTTFFGWSYDQSLLLAPIAQLVSWLFGPFRSSVGRWVVAIGAVVVLAASLAQRVISTDEVYFFWVPLSWGVIYVAASYLRRNTNSPLLS